jgi:hypothetical protein
MAQTPQHGDSEHNLLLKIADNFGVVANSGDSKNSILYKIADRTYQSAVNPPPPSYDPDALAYVQASGATDIQNINAFVVGIKALGLWNSMVCWPLRSIQNAGTGSTAYSLGGLGTYNGTLVNGPTWGADGVTTTNLANSRISTNTPNSLLFSQGTIAYIAKFETTYSSPYFHYWFPFPFQFIGFTGVALQQPTIQGGGNDFLSSINSPSPSNANFEFKAFSFGTSNIIGNRNGSTTGSMTRTQTPSLVSTDHTLTIGDTTASMGWSFNEDLTNTQMVALYSLYKSTLGQGLGLP